MDKKRHLMKYIIILLLLTGCSYPYIPTLRGDCVDRAVTLRQSLKKQGYEARIVMGMMNKNTGHCWVEYKRNNEWREIDR